MIEKDSKVRLEDIAKKSGVSIATVSRYFNGIKVRDDAVRKIIVATQKMGVSHITDNKLSISEKQLIIGMVVPNIKHNYCSKIVSGALEEARKNNQQIIIASSESNSLNENQILKSFSSLNLSGLIYMPVASWEGSVPEEIELFSNIPVVVVGRRNVLKNRVHIYTDNITGGYLATKYLLNLGRKRIAFCIGIWEYPFGSIDPKKLIQDKSKIGGFASLDRFTGYLNALDEFNIEYDSNLITVVGWDYEGGKMAAADILGKTQEFDSFITTSDTMASGLMETLKVHGYNIPYDVAVVGWDNSELANFTEPHLTSVEQPSEMMGRAASQSIIKLLKGEAVVDVVFDVAISPKGSTALKR